MADTETLQTLIEDASRVPLPRRGSPEQPPVIDLNVPTPRREIVIPAATVTMLEDYELYVD
jgi:hypothetical protein